MEIFVDKNVSYKDNFRFINIDKQKNIKTIYIIINFYRYNKYS